MKLKLPHTSGYYVDEFDGSIWSDKSLDTLNQIRSTNSFYKSTRPNSQLKYVIAQRNHDQLCDSAANYLGFAKFDFDPRYHEVKVTSNNDLKPLANRIELISTEQPLLSEFAKHAVIAKYYAKRTDGVQLPKPFDRFFVYPDNTVIGHYFKYKKPHSLQYADHQYLVFTAGTANQPDSTALCSWQMLAYHEDGVDFVLPLTRDIIKGLYKDLTENGGTKFTEYSKKYTKSRKYWDRKRKAIFFSGGDIQMTQHKTNNDAIQPTDDCRVLPFGHDKYYLDSAGNLFTKQKDGSFKYRTFQKANTAKDHWTLTVRNVIPGGRQSFDLWLSRDLLAGFASGKFTLELSPTVHPEIAEGSGSVFDRVQLVPGGCLDNQGIAWLIANRANNDFLAAANTGASGLRAITEFKSGDTVYVIFRNNVVIESLSKSYKVISLPGLHSQYVINQPKYRCINGWTRQEQLSEDVWDQIADLLSVEIPDDTDPNQFSNYDIINALEAANEKFLGRVPAISDRKLSVETAKVINHMQRDRAQVSYQYERTADWDTLNRTLNYLDELGLTLSNYHEATLRVSASDDAYWKSRGVLADETLNQIKHSADKYLDSDKADDRQCSDDAAVINEQTNDTKSGNVDIIVKSIYDIRHARKLKLKKKAKFTSVNHQSLDELMDYAGIADYKVKFELPNNCLTVKAMISQELFKLCGFDQIVKKKQH